MTPSIAGEHLRGDREANTNGEPDALKGARPVRKGIERKGLATAPRSQSTLHRQGSHLVIMRFALLLQGEIERLPAWHAIMNGLLLQIGLDRPIMVAFAAPTLLDQSK